MCDRTSDPTYYAAGFDDLDRVAVRPAEAEPGTLAELLLALNRLTADRLPKGLGKAAGPGSRRFRDLLRRERDDVGMLGMHVAYLYDAISSGRISKPNTYPFEVIAAFEERLNEAVDEAVLEAVGRPQRNGKGPA